jgi:hypothetical protein
MKWGGAGEKDDPDSEFDFDEFPQPIVQFV